MRPISQHRWVPDPREPDNPLRGKPEAPSVICDGVVMAQLVSRGLVVLLGGGTRALLTGAGRWCGQEEADDELGEAV